MFISNGIVLSFAAALLFPAALLARAAADLVVVRREIRTRRARREGTSSCKSS
jgi:hypothetical protein